MQTITSPALRQPQQPHLLCSPQMPCQPEDASPCPWSSRVWGSDYGEFWEAWKANNIRGSRGRISCSSIESGCSFESGSSFEDYILNSVVDDNNNDNNNNANNSNIMGSGISEEQLDDLSLTAASPATAPATTTTSGQEDTNNNTVVPAKEEDQANNNNNIKNNNTIEDQKGSSRTKNSGARTRLLDEDGFIRRAACVCLDETESKVLLVSSKKDPYSWLVPGGGVEAGEETPIAAMREAWEEAGVQGQITRYLGLFETQNHSGLKRHRTAVFVVSVKQVLAQYPEAHLGRRREWFSLEDGLLHLSRNRPLQSAYLTKLLPVSRLNVSPA